MLADKFRQEVVKPLNLDDLNVTKLVRNFMLRHLYNDKMLLSYIPQREFGSDLTFKSLMGAHVCDYDEAGNTIRVREGEKENYRLIRVLYESGLIQVRTDIRAPHVRCVIFSWIPEIEKCRRELLTTKLFEPDCNVTSALVSAIAELYGLSVKFISSRSAFEVTHLNGSPIQTRTATKRTLHTFIFANKKGEPVRRLRNMDFAEWEETLYDIAVKADALSHGSSKGLRELAR